MTTRSSARPRSTGLDLVRLVGVLAIVVAHTFTSDTVNVWTYSWHVPVFFVLSGYLWTPGRSLVAEARSRSRTLLVPYVVWLVVVLVVYVAVFHGSHLASAGRGALAGGKYATRPWTAFWFVSALLVAVIAYRLLERLPFPLFLTAVAAGYVANVIAGTTLAKLPLSIGTALGALSFIGFGQLMRAHPARRSVLVGLALIGASAVLIGTGVSNPLNMKVGDFGTPVLSALVACAVSGGLILLAQALEPALPRWATAVVAALSPALLVIVLFHAAVLLVVLDGFRAEPSLPGGLSAAVVLAFVLPAGLGVLLARSPLAQVTTGRPRAAPRAP